MRFILILIVLALAALAGLFVTGQMARPDTRTIEQEAINVGAV